MTRKRVLIVGCGFPQLSLVRAAKRRGLFVVGADANPHAVAVKHCDAFFPVSTSDETSLLKIIVSAQIDAVTTTGSEVSLKSTARVAERAALPFYANSETVRRCQDKDVMRAAYASAGLAVPAFARCEVEREARDFARMAGFPLVVKPARGWGQRGVARVEDESELVQAFDDARALGAGAGLAVVVVEAWIEGREYSVNGWVEGGHLVSHCVTERLTVPGRRPLGVMIAELAPSGLSEQDEATVVEQARLGARALGHISGPCYSQLALGPTGCFLFETAARLGGGFDADVTRLVSGVDLYDRVLDVALGEAVGQRQFDRATARAAIAKFLVVPPGIVRAVDGLESARESEGVDDAEVFLPVGGQALPLTDSAKRAAYVLAHGATRDEAKSRADAALAQIRIET